MTYDGLGDGVTFLTPPLPAETEITGPMAAKLFVSSATEDADLFLVVRVFAPNMKEVTFQGALDPHTPIAQGWLRASHRKLDPSSRCPTGRTTPTTRSSRSRRARSTSSTSRSGRPHRGAAGHRIGLTVRGQDYEYPGDISDTGESSAPSSPAWAPSSTTTPATVPRRSSAGT